MDESLESTEHCIQACLTFIGDALAADLRRLMQSRGMNAKEVAKRTALSVETVQALLEGREWSLEKLALLAIGLEACVEVVLRE